MAVPDGMVTLGYYINNNIGTHADFKVRLLGALLACVRTELD